MDRLSGWERPVKLLLWRVLELHVSIIEQTKYSGNFLHKGYWDECNYKILFPYVDQLEASTFTPGATQGHLNFWRSVRSNPPHPPLPPPKLIVIVIFLLKARWATVAFFKTFSSGSLLAKMNFLFINTSILKDEIRLFRSKDVTVPVRIPHTNQVRSEFTTPTSRHGQGSNALLSMLHNHLLFYHSPERRKSRKTLSSELELCVKQRNAHPRPTVSLWCGYVCLMGSSFKVCILNPRISLFHFKCILYFFFSRLQEHFIPEKNFGTFSSLFGSLLCPTGSLFYFLRLVDSWKMKTLPWST